MEILTADVWIIGSGAAGLMAAITARAEGADVAVLGKRAPGGGTATTLSVGAFAGPWEGLDVDRYLELTLNAGRGLNRVEMIEIMARESGDRFRDLLAWGMNATSEKGHFLAKPAQQAADQAPVFGREIVRCLSAKAEEMGVRFVSHSVVRRLAADDSGISMVAYSARRQGWFGLKGNAVVLAAGGAGGLYLHHDNPQSITGDAYTLAFEAGVELMDMEFVQFYPVAIAEPKLPSFLMAPDGVDLGEVVNSDGEDIYQKYDITARPAGTHSRDKFAQALFNEIEIEGREVFLDLTRVSKETWCANPVSAVNWGYLNRKYKAFDKPFRIAPLAHFACGGAITDEHGATSVPGLFSAGEASGGAHGANRMGGNALTECIVFGHRAGTAAARHAGSSEARSQDLKALMPMVSSGDPRSDVDALKLELREVMWRYGGISRSSEGLATGLEKVREIADQAHRTRGVNEPKQMEKFIELQLATGAAELILEAAGRRQESRGVHARTDFPEADDAAWLGHLCLRQGEAGTDWRFEPLSDAAGADTA